MTDLEPILERLGLTQYLENFIEEGFDSWETLLCVTESDLEALNVKLGHRRKLQKEIAHARGISIDQVIASGVRSLVDDGPQLDGVAPDSDARSTASQGERRGSKRKYRRHPKPDENAPEKPPSAYVIFSSHVREDLRPLNLSFTEIAKAVGERWQVLPPDQREIYETRAAAAKETYNAEMAKYKRTLQYEEYQRYLADFKARHSNSTSGGRKRTQLEPDSSQGSPAPSHSVTPVSHQRHPSGSSGTRPHILPRIPHLDTQPSSQHPRRSTKSPASLLRQDTSKSSVSSTFSTTSGGSAMTPVTPSEDPRIPRPLPPMISSSSHDSGYPQLAPKPGGPGFGPSASSPSLEYAPSSSYQSDSMELDRSRSHSVGHGSQTEAQSAAGHSHRKLDALSVLALAGHLVDKPDQSNTPPQ